MFVYLSDSGTAMFAALADALLRFLKKKTHPNNE